MAAGVRSDESTALLKAGWWSLLVLVFLLPLLTSNLVPGNGPLTLDPWGLPRLVFAGTCVGVALLAWGLAFARGHASLRWHPAAWLLLGFLAWAFVSSLTAIHVPSAFLGRSRSEGWVTLLVYFAAYFAALQYVSAGSRLRQLAQVFISSASLVSVYALLQFLGVEPMVWGVEWEANRAFATYGNPDLLGGFLTLPLAVACAMFLGGGKLSAWHGAATVLIACAMAVTFVRGAWLAAIAVMALLAFAAWRRSWRPARGQVWVGAAALGSLSVIALRSSQSDNDVVNLAKRLLTIGSMQDAGITTRVDGWRSILRVIAERPLLGVGPENLVLRTPFYATDRYVRVAGHLNLVDNAHNLPLHLAATTGLPGAALLLAGLGWPLARSATRAFSKESSPARWLYTGIWAAIAGYLVYSLSGISVLDSTIYLFIFSAAISVPDSREVAQLKPAVTSWVPAAIAAVLLVTVSVGGVRLLSADAAALQAQFAADPSTRLAAADRAVQLSPFDSRYRLLHAQAGEAELVSLNSGIRAAGGRAAAPSAQMQQARLALERVTVPLEQLVSSDSEFFDGYYFLARAYRWGAEDIDPTYARDAVRCARQGLKSYPKGVVLRLELARAHAILGEDDVAFAEAKRAVADDPNHDDAVALLVELATSDALRREALEIVTAETADGASGAAIISAADTLRSAAGTITP